MAVDVVDLVQSKAKSAPLTFDITYLPFLSLLALIARKRECSADVGNEVPCSDRNSDPLCSLVEKVDKRGTH